MVLNSLSFLPFREFTTKGPTFNVPELMSLILLIVLISVVLPAPDKPITATNSPWLIFKLTSINPLVPLG